MHKKISTSLVASLLLSTNIYANDTVQLDEITVTSATKSTQSIKDVTSNIDVITKEEIEERNFTTVTEALNTISGISFTSNGGLGNQTSVFLRGMSSNRILVLIDGIKVNDVTSSSGAQFEHLMITDIERIEVLKGAQSGIWGADASAGVINIISKEAKNGTSGDLNLEYGSYKTKKIGLNIAHKTKDFYVKGSLSRLKTDGYTSKAPRGEDIDNYEDDSYENTSANIKAGYNFDDNNKIDLSHSLINAEAEYDGSNDDLDNTHSKTKDNFSSLNFNHSNDLLSLDLHANKSNFHREYVSSSTSEYDGSILDFGIKSNIKYLNESSFLIVGTDYKEFKHKNTINKETKSKSIFLTNNNTFNNDMTIFTQSLRYDRYSNFDNKITGKVGVKQYINKDLFFTTNYGTAYNTPTLTQMYGLYGPNPSLSPESTKSFDIGFDYKGFSATYFNQKIKNLIDWYDPDNWFGPIPGEYKNLTGVSKLRGYELGYSKNLNDDILLSLNYTHLSAQDSEGKDLARRAKRQLGFAVDYYGFDKLHLNVNGSYIGTRYNSADKGGASTGNYTLWNTVANYKINKTFSTYLKVDNLFNKYYQTVDGYATAERSAYIGLKATF